MLVYLNEPMGYSTIDGHRVYGKCFSYGRFGPTDIPFALYKKNKARLEDAVYTPSIIKEMFGISIPDVSFRISKIHLVDFEVLVAIARAFGIDYRVGRSKPTFSERLGLRKAVIAKITS